MHASRVYHSRPLRPFEATASLQTPLVRFLLAPLEIPKLANAQPSNFGPLPYFNFSQYTIFCIFFLVI